MVLLPPSFLSRNYTEDPNAPTDYPRGPVQLPTLDLLGVDKSSLNLDDPRTIARNWLIAFSSNFVNCSFDNAEFLSLFHEDAYFRDILALTWDYRTFRGNKRIAGFLNERALLHSIHNFQLDDGSDDFYTAGTKSDIKHPSVEEPVPGLLWIQAFFTFDSKVGRGSGIVRLIPHKDGEWRALTVFTMLENIEGHEENLRGARPHSVTHGTWLDTREQEKEFKDSDPPVVILGAGQSGLDVAARLKAIGIPSLAVDRAARVGDNWRDRYRFLTLHDPVWYDHMPFLPFPENWPVYTPAGKLANWLESYAETFELNVWTSSNIKSADFDEEAMQWIISVERADGSIRTIKPRHFVVATGIGAGLPKFPSVKDWDKFQGKVIHSSQHTDSKSVAGKKVVVVGASTSAHDICQDLYQGGVPVTMIQRNPTYVMSVKNGVPVIMGNYREGGPPTDVVDRINASLPNYLSKGLSQRAVQHINTLDQDLLDSLNKAGFQTYDGIDDAGFMVLALERAGGYYLDVGCSKLIADGKIKVKSGHGVDRLVSDGLVLENGEHVEADVIIFATGFGDMREGLRGIVEDKVVDKLNKIWGFDPEYEMNSAWRFSGHPRLYFMMGNLAMCRFQSKSLALQIKALELGLFEDSDRYSLNGSGS